MIREEVLDMLSEIIRDVFDDENMTVEESTYFKDLEDWDSVTQMTLMAMIENEFKVRFGLEQMMNMECVGDIVECVWLMRNRE